MKNIKLKIISIFLLSTLIYISCDESTIELDPIGPTEAGFFQNEDEMTMAVMGMYNVITVFYQFRSANWLSSIWLLPDDNLTTPGTANEESIAGLTGSYGKLRDFYKYGYNLINRTNVILQKIEENGDFAYASEPELKDYHKGEALFLRAWMHFRLWNVFGTVPVVDERIEKLENANLSNSQGTELLDQAIADLEQAAQLLPESWEDKYIGRATKNAAHGLKGKILVFRGTVSKNQADFTDAIAEFDMLDGLSLMSNYYQNFSSEFENNEESLFEYQASGNHGLSHPFLTIDIWGGADITAYFGFFNRKPGWIGNNYYTVTESLRNAFTEDDPRVQYLFLPDTVGLVNVIKYVRDGSFAQGFFSPNYTLLTNNPRVLRYADILLLKAEAIVRSAGSLSEAIGLINQVRQRARLSTEDGTEAAEPADLNINETNSNTVLEWIFNERRLELAFEEGHRWWDLRRRHIAGEINLKTHDFSSLSTDFKFEDHNVNFPIPEGEVLENPNLNQNIGY